MITKKRKTEIQNELKKYPQVVEWTQIPYFTVNLFVNVVDFIMNQDDAKSVGEAVMKFDKTMRDNPYLAIRYPRLGLSLIDNTVTRLPSDHPWHVNWFAEVRIAGMFQAVFKVSQEQGETVLNRRELMKKVFLQIMDATPSEFINDEVQAKVAERIKQCLEFEEVNYHDDEQHLQGLMSSHYQDMIQRLADLITMHVRNGADDDVDESFLQQPLYDDNGEVIQLDEMQINAVKNLLTQPVSVLTGYAGTGKSTLLKAVVKSIQSRGLKVKLCAYAGKAAYNLRQITGAESSTIASLLYADRKFKADYLIIDEISMVGESDLYGLLKLIPEKCHVIMVGDKAQLPAVKNVGVLTGLSSFLAMHDSIYHQDLRHVYRNSGELLSQATDIRNWNVPINYEDVDGSLRYRRIHDIDDVVSGYLKFAKHFGTASLNVITPQNAAVDYLNEHVQDALAQQEHRQVVFDDTSLSAHLDKLYVGDKVLITKNSYNVQQYHSDDYGNVFNGFIGVVSEPFYEGGEFKGAVLRFDGLGPNNTALYYPAYFNKDCPSPSFRNGRRTTSFCLDNVSLGYALTVHKSQGSTIEHVLFYLPADDMPLLTNQLLYTAFTRGKSMVVFTNRPLKADSFVDFVHRDSYETMNSILGYELAKRLD